MITTKKMINFTRENLLIDLESIVSVEIDDDGDLCLTASHKDSDGDCVEYILRKDKYKYNEVVSAINTAIMSARMAVHDV